MIDSKFGIMVLTALFVGFGCGYAILSNKRGYERAIPPAAPVSRQGGEAPQHQARPYTQQDFRRDIQGMTNRELQQLMGMMPQVLSPMDRARNRMMDLEMGSTSPLYRGSSGALYQYDLSNPSDQLRYSVDPGAQLRDSVDPRVQLDRALGSTVAVSSVSLYNLRLTSSAHGGRDRD
jgi:hypothetical protein